MERLATIYNTLATMYYDIKEDLASQAISHKSPRLAKACASLPAPIGKTIELENAQQANEYYWKLANALNDLRDISNSLKTPFVDVMSPLFAEAKSILLGMNQSTKIAEYQPGDEVVLDQIPEGKSTNKAKVLHTDYVDPETGEPGVTVEFDDEPGQQYIVNPQGLKQKVNTASQKIALTKSQEILSDYIVTLKKTLNEAIDNASVSQVQTENQGEGITSRVLQSKIEDYERLLAKLEEISDDMNDGASEQEIRDRLDRVADQLPEFEDVFKSEQKVTQKAIAMKKKAESLIDNSAIVQQIRERIKQELDQATYYENFIKMLESRPDLEYVAKTLDYIKTDEQAHVSALNELLATLDQSQLEADANAPKEIGEAVVGKKKMAIFEPGYKHEEYAKDVADTLWEQSGHDIEELLYLWKKEQNEWRGKYLAMGMANNDELEHFHGVVDDYINDIIWDARKENEKTGTIKKLPNGQYRLYSHEGKNLGTFDSKSKAEKHEREVQFFKHQGFALFDEAVKAQVADIVAQSKTIKEAIATAFNELDRKYDLQTVRRLVSQEWQAQNNLELAAGKESHAQN